MVGYTDAYYPDAAFGAPVGGVAPLLNAAGDKLANVLPWTAAANVEYSRDISPVWRGARSYIRVDYRWLSAANAINPDTASYDPETSRYQNQAYGILNLRLGVAHEGLDASIYVNNATKSDPLLGYAHDVIGDPMFYGTAIRPFLDGSIDQDATGSRNRALKPDPSRPHGGTSRREIALTRYGLEIAKGGRDLQDLSSQRIFATVACRRVDAVSWFRQIAVADPAGHGGKCLARAPPGRLEQLSHSQGRARCQPGPRTRIELSRHRNRLALVLENPGGAVLDRLLGQPLEITAFLANPRSRSPGRCANGTRVGSSIWTSSRRTFSWMWQAALSGSPASASRPASPASNKPWKRRK